MSEMIYCGGKTCHGHGDYAVCGKVYWHDIYQCDSCRAKQKEKIVEELEQKLAESQREFRAADATIENLQMHVEKLAAENAGLKAAAQFGVVKKEGVFSGDDSVFMGTRERIVPLEVKTPATDAFLAEVRAQGVETAIDTAKNVVAQEFQYKDFETAQRVCSKFPESDLVGKVEMVEWLEDFAAQLRKGVQS